MIEEALPIGWALSRFEEILIDPKADLVDGPFGSNLKSSEYVESGVPVLKIQNIKADRFVRRHFSYVTQKKAAHLSRHSFVPGDLMVTKLGDPLGICCEVPNDFPQGVFVADLMRLRLRTNRILKRFLLLVINSQVVQNQFKRVTKGTTRPRVNLTLVRSLEFPLPPYNEQQRIVAKIEELFSELDAGEESLRNARRQLGVYRQSLLKQAFEGKLTATWREQNPQLLEAPEQFIARIQIERELSKNSEATSRGSRRQCTEMPLDSQLVRSLPLLPESWRWTALGNLTLLITKGSSPKWQGFDYTCDASGVLFVTSENVRSGFLDLARPKYLGLGFNQIQAKSLLQDGDVLLNIVGASIGRAAVFQGDAVANVNQAVALIRLMHFLNRQFLTHHLNSPRMYQLVTSKAVDVARANFSLADVNEIPVPLCSLAEQKEIVRLLDEQFTVIKQNEQEIDAALKRGESLRQSILKKAFSGQLVAQDSADEPASELLKRIRAERDSASQTKNASRRLTQTPAAAPVGKDESFPNIVPFKPLGKTDLQAGIVALAVDAFMTAKQFMGHTIAEKVVHLTDYMADLQLDRNPIKDAAGPNDFKKAKSVETRAKMKGWFTVQKKGPVYFYNRGKNLDSLLEGTRKTLGSKLSVVENLLGEMVRFDTEKAEIFATVFAAWNNLLLRNEPITEEAIVTEARENWHPKKLLLDRGRFFKALAWMKTKGFIPKGTGKIVASKKS